MIRLFKVLIPVSIIALLLTEIALLFGSYVAIAYAMMDLDPELFLLYENGLLRIGVNVLIIVAGLYFNNLYSTIKVRSRTRLVQQICMVFGIAFIAQAVLAYINADWVLPRWMMIGGSAIALVAVIIWRVLFSLGGPWSIGSQRIVFVGAHPIVFEMARSLESRPELGMRVEGYLATEDTKVSPPLRRLGTPSQLADIAADLKPQRISFVPGTAVDSIRPDDLIEVQFAGIDTEKATDTYEAVFSRVCTSCLQPADFILTNDYCPQASSVKLQTGYAFVIALALAVLTLPLAAFIALTTKLTSRGPILSRIRCLGLEGKPFNLLQFRTAPSDTGEPSLSSPRSAADPRLTSFGRHMRRSGLDRLPALWNVLRGDMSIVGPRPEQEAFGRRLAHHIPFYAQRYSVRPGMIGWAQINASRRGEPDDALTRLEYDLYYVKNLSSALDLNIASQSLKMVLLSRSES